MSKHPYGMTGRLAEAMAHRIDRRQVLRKTSRYAFFMLALAAAGEAEIITASKAFAHTVHCSGSIHVGLGCPGSTYGYPCGPSRCCNYIRPGYPSTCNCANGSSCISGTTHCTGLKTNIYPTGCWTCTYVNNTLCKIYTTTCCDCGTSGCGDPNDQYGPRCVGHSTTVQNGCIPPSGE